MEATEGGPVQLSRRAETFTESVIRDMTRLALQYGAVNLSQGFPDFAAPDLIKEAAIAAIRKDINQYAITWGNKSLREVLAAKFKSYNGVAIDPETDITVCCGATEAMIAALLAVTNPGDEIIVFEPFYENYGPDGILCDASVRYVTLHPPDWSFDSDELKSAFSSKTKAIIVNTPHNPAGKVFSEKELKLIAELCQKYDSLAITDEIYEHILYDGAKHMSMASLPGMRDRTITISGISKTYALTGWRVGWCIAEKKITNSIRKVHDFLTVGAPAPLQEGAVAGLKLGNEYYQQLAQDYLERRDFLWNALEKAGFGLYEKPQGAYYIIADISQFGYSNDVEFAKYLVKDVGIAVVPGSSFYSRPELGSQQVRFAFCKKMATLEAAAQKLKALC
ncbi:aminotransferase class I/II-fold pyridoxal phosphate-dependent enzyme [Candidatus Acetothermia bacterium]|nr:aminotransferase class I/II-fold pyridoxal phosphate-dependent enzyme [Candidatus Acetothermia bacterium]